MIFFIKLAYFRRKNFADMADFEICTYGIDELIQNDLISPDDQWIALLDFLFV